MLVCFSYFSYFFVFFAFFVFLVFSSRVFMVLFYVLLCYRVCSFSADVRCLLCCIAFSFFFCFQIMYFLVVLTFKACRSAQPTSRPGGDSPFVLVCACLRLYALMYARVCAMYVLACACLCLYARACICMCVFVLACAYFRLQAYVCPGTHTFALVCACCVIACCLLYTSPSPRD